LKEFPVAGCENPGVAEQSEAFSRIAKVAEKNDTQPHSPEEQEKTFQVNGPVHDTIPPFTSELYDYSSQS
jgi:hypothetical protein